MTKFLVVAAAVAALISAAVPANAQVFLGADRSGVGVQVGPLGVGVGPRFSDDYRYRHRRGYRASAYSGDCQLIRARVVTRSGRVVYRTRQVCG